MYVGLPTERLLASNFCYLSCSAEGYQQKLLCAKTRIEQLFKLIVGYFYPRGNATLAVLFLAGIFENCHHRFFSGLNFHLRRVKSKGSGHWLFESWKELGNSNISVGYFCGEMNWTVASWIFEETNEECLTFSQAISWHGFETKQENMAVWIFEHSKD